MRVIATNLTPQLGARVQALDATKPIDAGTATALRELLADRKLLLFRQGELSVEQQMTIMSVFGPVIVETPSGEPFSLVTNVDPKGYVIGGDKLVFHADYQFTPYGPLQVLSLYAVEMHQAEPTVYYDMVAGAAKLPAGLRSRMDALNVVQLLDYSSNFSESRRSRLSARQPNKPDSQYPHCTQPMIQIHPGTGRPYVNVSQMQTSHVEGWSDADSDALFAEMEASVYVPDNMYRHLWAEHDLVVWDNIALQHGREALAKAARRTLRRVAVNNIDVPTMMRDARPDPVRFAVLQWHKDEPTSAVG